LGGIPFATKVEASAFIEEPPKASDGLREAITA